MRVVFVLVLLVLAGAAVAQAQPEPVRTRDVLVGSFDGVTLAATLYWTDPAEERPLPAVLTTHGWASDRSSRAADARWLAQLGYVVLAYDSRGYGGSDGVVGLNGPDEVRDVAALVEYLAGLANATAGPRVRLDAPGDPRVGMTGVSYAGAIQLLAAARDPRLDALQPDITWNDLATSLVPAGVVKRAWVDYLFWGGTVGSHTATDGSADAEGMDARLRDWYTQAHLTGHLPDDAYPALAERSPGPLLRNVTAPVLLTQGWPDTLFDPDQAIASYLNLTARDGVDTHLLLHPGGHGQVTEAAVRDHVRGEVARFLARHLGDGTPREVPPLQYHRPAQDDWVTLAGWPPETAQHVSVAPVDSGTLVLAQAAAPTSRTEDQELQDTLGLPASDLPVPTSAIVPLDLVGPRGLVGTPRARFTVEPSHDDVTLFLSLVDLGAAPLAVVQQQVKAVRLSGQAGTAVDLDLPLVSTVHHLQAGHRLGLRIATSDAGYHGGRDLATLTIDLASMTVVLPLEGLVGPMPIGASSPSGDEGRGAPGLAPGLALLAMLGWLRATAQRGANTLQPAKYYQSAS